MRIWDVQVKLLCRKHLLGEHRELHGLWNILTIHGCKGGYANHPETRRWIGKLKALYNRHEALVAEMEKRKYRHQSPLDKRLATGKATQSVLINTVEEQEIILANKPCECFLRKNI
jgi:hypothetical protein